MTRSVKPASRTLSQRPRTIKAAIALTILRLVERALQQGVDGEVAAVVKKQLFTFFSCTFTVDVPGPDDLTAKGSFTDHEYVFSRGDREVARVSKEWFALRDTYGVDIDEGEDAVLILVSTVVIDMACHPSNER